MTRKDKSMFIYDDEIRERFGDEAEQIIADLDADPLTKKGYATWPAEARSKVHVERYLRMRAEQQR